MRILSLDVGTRRIGVALSDPLGLTAQGLTVLTRQSRTKDLEVLCALVKQHAVETIVVGLPLTMRGERGPQARQMQTLARQLEGRCGVPVELVDERLTTAQSERILLEGDVSRRKRKHVIDQMAAQLILQHYLDVQGRRRADEEHP